MKNRDLEKIIDEFALVNDPLFSEAFNERPDRAEFLVKDVLEYLEYEDFEVVSSKTQNRKSHLFHRDTITDIEVRLNNDDLITVEIQISNPDRFTPRRARFILSSNDVTHSEEGMKFKDIPNQILIVISRTDLNKTGLPIVTVRKYIKETGQVFDDGVVEVYLNLENTTDNLENVTDKKKPINQFIRDLFETDYQKIKNEKAREILKTYKETQEGRMQVEGRLEQLINRENEQIIEKYEDRISTIEKKHANQISDLKEEYTDQISDLKEEYTDQISDLEEEQASLKEEIIWLKKKLADLTGDPVV